MKEELNNIKEDFYNSGYIDYSNLTIRLLILIVEILIMIYKDK